SVVPSTWRSRRAFARLSADTIHHATALAYESGATLYTVLLAAFSALVHRYTHATDILVAAPVMNRRAGTENAIGCYGNTVLVRTQPKARQTFRELLGQVRESVSGALAHQRVSVDTLVRESNRDRDPSAARM